METVKLTQGQVDRLAHSILRMQDQIVAWFEDPAVQADYQAWMATQGERIAKRAKMQEEIHARREEEAIRMATVNPVRVPA